MLSHLPQYNIILYKVPQNLESSIALDFLIYLDRILKAYKGDGWGMNCCTVQ